MNASHPFSALLATPVRRIAALDVAFVHDGCAMLVTDRDADRLSVAHLDFRIPSPAARLDPILVCEEYVARAVSMGCRAIVADVHYLETVRHFASRAGIPLINAPVGDERTRAFVMLRDYTRRKVVSMPRLAADHLRAIKLLARPGGSVSIVAERTASKGHADLAYALVAAVWHDARMHGPIGMSTPSPGVIRGSWDSP